MIDKTVFYELIRRAITRQISLLNYMINHLHTPSRPPMQVFLTGPADSGKSYTVLMVKEIYNRFTDNCGTLNAYIVAASTGKAAVAIDGTTIHTALSISTIGLNALSTEKANLYRSLFRYVKILIIDECSMIGVQMLIKIDERLKQITGNYDCNLQATKTKYRRAYALAKTTILSVRYMKLCVKKIECFRLF